MDTKVTTVIVNDTKHGLTMKVGNRNCYTRLTSVKVGGEYQMQLDVNWTYREFLVQDQTDRAKQLFINSDDCCDYERITIKDIDGAFGVHRELREQFRTSSGAEEGSGSTGATSSWKLWLYKLMYV
jgi:hypothetical protein